MRVFTCLTALTLIAACGGGASQEGAASSGSFASIRDKSVLATSVTQFVANGWYWNPSEGGTGFMFEAQGNRAFVAFFLYEEVTRKPIWYAAYGGFNANSDGSYSFAGELRYYTQGQAITDPTYRSGTSRSIGEVGIRFTGNNAAVQLPGGRTIAATRFDIAQSGYNFNSPTPNKPIQPEVGWYWNPDEGGRGYAIEVQNNRVFMAMFHYNEDGTPTWNIFDSDISTGVARGSFLRYEGGQTLTSTYRNPEQPINRGRFSMSFRSACAGQLQFEGVSAIRIRRFVIDGSPLAYGSECRAPSVNWYQSLRFLPIQPGDSVFGTTGNPQPGYDMFRVELVAGTTYTIDLKGSSSGAGTLNDPTLELEYAGTVLATNDNRAPGTTDAQIQFTPSLSSALYSIRAKAKGSDTGSFLLSVSGVASGLDKAPIPPLSTYAGLFKGRWSGQRTGSLDLAIAATGIVTGSVTPDGSTAAPLSGKVTDGGLIDFSSSGPTPVSFRGFLSPSGPMSGSWRMATEGSAGNFLVSRSGENLLERLYGQVGLTYSFNGSSNVYTDRVVFSAANLSANRSLLTNFISGSSSRSMGCSVADPAASVTTYLCLAKYDFSGALDLFLFNVSLGQVVNGKYEFCLDGESAFACGTDLAATPDGTVSGSISSGAAGADKAVSLLVLAADPANIESSKSGSKVFRPTVEAVAIDQGRSGDMDRLVEAIKALKSMPTRPAAER